MAYSPDLAIFLRHRGISEDTINLFEEQKVDREAILLMEDAQLAAFLPSFGDRVALFNFCKTQTSSLKRRQGMLEKLRETLKQSQTENNSRLEFPDSFKNTGIKRKAVTRMIEIGWIHNEKRVSKQVRAKQGGGTRKVSMNTQAEFDDILDQGKILFFPEGRSSKGDVSDFDFDVWDFKKNSLPKGLSIENIYNRVKLPHLRFYLATRPKSKLTEGEVSCITIKSDPDLLADVTQEFTHSEQCIGDSLEIKTEASFSHVDSKFLNRKTISDPEITPGPQESVDEDVLTDLLVDELPQSHLASFGALVKAFSDADSMSKTLTVQHLLHKSSVGRSSASIVLRDVYSSFWSQFYKHCTVGATFKVPFLRHDFAEATWKAIGRILVKGFHDCQFFPTKLAPPFVEEILFGSVHSNLMASFLQFVSRQEQSVLQCALSDFSSVDLDDLLELLDSFECRKSVKAANLPVILNEISHKELIQKPMFVIHCWRQVIQPHVHLSSWELTKMYADQFLKRNP